MKLKYRYYVDTWARDETQGLKSLTRRIRNCEVEFLFDDGHKLRAIDILIPNASVTYSTGGTIQPLDKSNDAEAHIIANYIVNVLQEETGKCDIIKTPDTPEYVSETPEEKTLLEGKVFTRTRSIFANAIISGSINFSEKILNKYIKQIDAFAIYSDAKRMTNPVGKFREFFRVLEHFFPYEGEEFDRKASKYFGKYDSKFTEKFVYRLRQLRNRCTHAKKNYITSNDIEGMDQVKTKLKDIHTMAKLLINNPPRLKILSRRGT
jgi:hypothetical protein